jgi:hypothetical protein
MSTRGGGAEKREEEEERERDRERGCKQSKDNSSSFNQLIREIKENREGGEM